MKAIKTILQQQAKMYDFKNDPMLGKKAVRFTGIDDPDVAYDMARDDMVEDEVEQEMLNRKDE